MLERLFLFCWLHFAHIQIQFIGVDVANHNVLFFSIGGVPGSVLSEHSSLQNGFWDKDKKTNLIIVCNRETDR